MFQFGKDFVVYFRKTYFTKNKSEMKNNDKTEEKDIEVKDGNVEATATEGANEAETTDRNEEMTEENSDVNAKLEAAEKEIEQLRDRYLRTAAEFDNYKKRTLKEKAELLLNQYWTISSVHLLPIPAMLRLLGMACSLYSTSSRRFLSQSV